MPRDITDPTGGTIWTCAQAFAGLGGGTATPLARRPKPRAYPGSENRFRVVCTPSGGARSVRLELPGGWDAEMPDEALLAAIRAELDEAGRRATEMAITPYGDRA